jgi:protein TonB
MKTPVRLLVYLFLVNMLTAQTNKVCNSEVVVIEDRNTINKCQIKSNKTTKNTTRKIFLRLDDINNRFLRKRKTEAPKIYKAKEAVKALANIDAAGVKSDAPELAATVTEESLAAEKLSNVPLTLNEVDFIPVFKSCKDMQDVGAIKCFKKEIGTHIQNNFEYPEEALEEEITGKITVEFIFTKKGKIKISKIIDDNEEQILGNYTKDLILKLPKFVPAKKNGKNVPLRYELSLDFSL